MDDRPTVIIEGNFAGISATDENSGFTIRFATRTVRIEGQNLLQLFHYVSNFRAAEVGEVDERTVMQVTEGKAAIWRILVK